MVQYPDITRFFLSPLSEALRNSEESVLSSGVAPMPDEFIECLYEPYAGETSILPPVRGNEKTFVVTPSAVNEKMLLFTSFKKRMPAFWRIELFVFGTGEMISEATYLKCWNSRKKSGLLFLSFSTTKAGMNVFVCGRLIEVVLFVFLYELREERIDQWTKCMSLTTIHHGLIPFRNDLETVVSIHFEAGKNPFSAQLCRQYEVCTDVLELFKNMGQPK